MMTRIELKFSHVTWVELIQHRAHIPEVHGSIPRNHKVRFKKGCPKNMKKVFQYSTHLPSFPRTKLCWNP